MTEMPPVTQASEVARAKINLALHVTGRRADGYHLLDSLVTFCETGDRLEIAEAQENSFSVSGPFSAALGAPTDNLVLKARDGLRQRLAAAGIITGPVAIHLEKNLPVASGIGGGSADAAAALHGLLRVWKADLEPQEGKALLLSLGADVPMCFVGTPLAARGIGEDITPLPQMPAMALVLGNPLIGVSTPAIFKALERRDNPPVGALPALSDLGGWIDCLSALRNDMEPAATMLVPEIATLRAMLDAEGALLSRMSGSGATCFGIFETIEKAKDAAAKLRRQRPDWYFCATSTMSA
ncbi:4-(cytidine 5'-diphospho)-2-C-methyl-D-erythritol kinase [Rhizobiales bacterium RZME27]|uniref:4-diphosphocytidyl-2-C-methyl-D-erythritol kinase n=1 Tax=Endobacterium cereale TaxID=2663029 RepID=A0A6A8ACN3_9HYPH|nr:4-(cytidine 5'-diphospho)-2-C-methyl-D-erythritol kinase [Endobacterium cereale]MEB2846914.1 4-(cytidine 5'-diphospho)-2-C-methyl-D-erythritol kinase [Endobacterium cereale]MQY47667.1 4-(cytidine 5'-diphospho)-2-C-methyl-D-erythritol kinase [Endobacterium cereale]